VAIRASVEPRALRQLRAAHERQDEEIRRLIAEAVGAGIRSQDIAEALGISRSTLWRHYADELRQREDGAGSTATTNPGPGPTSSQALARS
jgi:DNA invertase Pin-like site-specific DNA recombinase